MWSARLSEVTSRSRCPPGRELPQFEIEGRLCQRDAGSRRADPSRQVPVARHLVRPAEQDQTRGHDRGAGQECGQPGHLLDAHGLRGPASAGARVEADQGAGTGARQGFGARRTCSALPHLELQVRPVRAHADHLRQQLRVGPAVGELAPVGLGQALTAEEPHAEPAGRVVGVRRPPIGAEHRACGRCPGPLGQGGGEATERLLVVQREDPIEGLLGEARLQVPKGLRRPGGRPR